MKHGAPTQIQGLQCTRLLSGFCASIYKSTSSSFAGIRYQSVQVHILSIFLVYTTPHIHLHFLVFCTSIYRSKLIHNFWYYVPIHTSSYSSWHIGVWPTGTAIGRFRFLSLTHTSDKIGTKILRAFTLVIRHSYLLTWKNEPLQSKTKSRRCFCEHQHTQLGGRTSKTWLWKVALFTCTWYVGFQTCAAYIFLF